MLTKKPDNSLKSRPRIVEKYDSRQGEIIVSLATDDMVVGETELVLEHKKEKERD